MIAPASPTPYLSVVATARNDNHGGDLLGRMNLFINGLMQQAESFRLPLELILVEWNPPEENARLHEALRLPEGGQYGQIRFITVPNDTHSRFEHSDALPLFQMIGKNVGIRRARGEFVLATNIDLLFSHALIKCLAKKKLRRDRLVRIDRTDVAEGVPAEGSLDDQLAWCEQNIIRVNGRDATLDLRTQDEHRIYHPMDHRAWLLEKLQDWDLVPVVTRKRLHLNGCGDFTLLHRDRWAMLRGYPEFEMFSMHLDSVLCTAAYFSGCREQVLQPPMRCYHVEHAVGSGWSKEGEAKLNARLEKAGIPQTSNQQFDYTAKGMRRRREPRIYNEENWGLVSDTFEEIIHG
ncbi:MAG: hypothetical protein AAF797_07230 [Planctomycetota bacterium]